MKNQQLKIEGYIYFALFAVSIFIANYLIRNVGTECHGNVCLIPMWPSFGIGDGLVPSGVLVIGFSFTLRDLVQRRLGLRWAWGAVVLGAVLSALLDRQLAFASGVAFLLAESLDLMVYTPLQRRNLTLAVLGSNVVGFVTDSFVFLYLAGIPMMFVEGQIIGKFYMTLIALPIIWWIRRYDNNRGLITNDAGQTVFAQA